MTSKVIATVAVGPHEELIRMSIGRLNQYAKLHGYEISVCKVSLDTSRPPAWTKLLHILNLLENFEEVFWIDSDAVIIDTSKDIAEVVKEETDIAWVYHTYDNQTHPNTGVMYIRSNRRTRELFETANKQTDLTNHPWWDQAAIMRVLGIAPTRWPFNSSKVSNELLLREQRLTREWNSIRQDPAEQAIIRHFAGEEFWVRKFLIAEYSLPFSNSSETLEEMIRVLGIRNEELQDYYELQSKHQELKHHFQELQSQNEEMAGIFASIYSSQVWRVSKLLRDNRNTILGKLEEKRPSL